MICIKNLTYSYERTPPVLRDISLSESEPVITGLWGRNGAGKTMQRSRSSMSRSTVWMPRCARDCTKPCWRATRNTRG